MKLISRTALAGGPARDWKKGALAAAVLFCISTFALSSFRASLNPEITFELLNPKRIALIVAGAGIFWLAIRRTDRLRPDTHGLRRILVIAVPGLVLLFTLAVGWDILVDRRMDNLAARNLRWILLWSGYFGTGIAAWLAVQYGAALTQAQALQVSDGISGDDVDDGFWVKTGRQTIRIARDAVEWIEAEGNYARIHASDSAHGLVRMTLAGIEGELDRTEFVRIHRSALCRRSAIRGYRRKPSGAMLVLLASGDEAPLGRSYAKDLLEHSRSGTFADGQQGDDTVSRRQPEAQPG